MINNIKAGFYRVDITPEKPVPLGGYGNADKRISTSVRDNLYLSCYALTDTENNTVLLMNYDLIQSPEFFADFAKEELNKLYGIPKENIFLAATHTHSSPEIRSLDFPYIKEYDESIKEAILVCAKEALDDRSEAEVYTGDIKTKRLNFVRHYKATLPNGDEFYYGDNMNNHLTTDEIIQKYSTHATKPDERIHLIKFKRNGKKDLIIANWRAHATLTGGMKKYEVSADFPGELRKFTEKKTDCFFTYFQGAAGNMNPKTMIDSERIAKDCTYYSDILSDTVIKGLENLRPADIKPIKIISRKFKAPVNHLEDQKAEIAEKVHRFFRESGDRKAANVLARENGFYTVYHAGAVMRKSKQPQFIDLDISAFTLGEIAFITVPNEMFDTTSKNIEDRTDFNTLFTFGYCNGSLSYLPTKAAYNYGCYEAYNSNYLPGTAEMLEDTFVCMLNELKNGSLPFQSK